MKNMQLKLVDCHICCIGAVFDFYAGTVNRAPRWMIQIHLEWFYRLIMEPKRMWRRYLLGNLEFVLEILKELKITARSNRPDFFVETVGGEMLMLLSPMILRVSLTIFISSLV